MTDLLVEQDPTLTEIVSRLVAAIRPQRICFFGSVARRDPGPDSSPHAVRRIAGPSPASHS